MSVGTATTNSLEVNDSLRQGCIYLGSNCMFNIYFGAMVVSWRTVFAGRSSVSIILIQTWQEAGWRLHCQVILR